MFQRVLEALHRCRHFSLSVLVTYVLSATVGIAMVHMGSRFALGQRDRIVGASSADPASRSHQSGHDAKAALLDAANNFVYAAIPQTVAGLTVVLPYASVSYQGWVGGIVSVDGARRTRFRTRRGGTYYVAVLLLQFIPFSLCIGAGIRCGVTLYVHNQHVGWRFWRYRAPRRDLVDLLSVVCLALPFFLLASAFEFLSPWNV